MNKTDDVVEEITIFTQLADEHTWDLTVVFWDTDSALNISHRLIPALLQCVTYEFDDIGVAELG